MGMSKLPVYLYPNDITLIIDPDNNRNTNNTMYQRKLQLQKGFSDTVNIVFKNSDQKPIPLSTTTTYTIDLLDSAGRQLVLSKPITIVDDGITLALRGAASLSFNPIDTINLAAGSYKFIVKRTNADGSYTPAYANTYYGITGEIEILEDGFPIGFPVQTVTLAQLEAGKQLDFTPAHRGYSFYSPWIRPYHSATTTPTLTSAIISLNNFVGVVSVEGTLDNTVSGAGSANAAAATISSYTINTASISNLQLSWNGTYVAYRFVVYPNADGFGVNYYPTGFPIGSNLNNYPNGFIDRIQLIS